jgi:hypothetical protein
MAGEWVPVEGWAVPLKVNTVAMEELLWKYMEDNAEQKFQPREDYTYQYKTINDHELLINAMCDTFDTTDLTKEFVEVLDGGSCYFQATYDFKVNVFVKLVVNGEAEAFYLAKFSSDRSLNGFSRRSVL